MDNPQPLVDKRVLEALTRVLEYLWADEREDYKSAPHRDHIFESLVVLQRFLASGE